MLEIHRQARILATCEENRLEYVLDQTNFQPNITYRNAIRHWLSTRGVSPIYCYKTAMLNFATQPDNDGTKGLSPDMKTYVEKVVDKNIKHGTFDLSKNVEELYPALVTLEENKVRIEQECRSPLLEICFSNKSDIVQQPRYSRVVADHLLPLLSFWHPIRSQKSPTKSYRRTSSRKPCATCLHIPSAVLLRKRVDKATSSTQRASTFLSTLQGMQPGSPFSAALWSLGGL